MPMQNFLFQSKLFCVYTFSSFELTWEGIECKANLEELDFRYFQLNFFKAL